MVSEHANDRARELLRFDSGVDFAEATMPFLLEHEVEHGLLLGLTARLITTPQPYGEAPYLALVRDSRSVVVAGLIIPPRGMVISRVADSEAVRVLAADVWQRHPVLPDVNGSRDASLTFASAWKVLSDRSFYLTSTMKIHRADTINPPANVPGILRRATTDDRQLMIEWMDAFFAERYPDSAERQTVPADVDQRLYGDESGWYLWEDGQPVALVGYAGPTARGIRIGPVYTPPAFRRRGYGSAATASVTQQLLNEGYRYCFLYTDTDNAYVKTVYFAIGYRHVADVSVYAFASHTGEPI